MKQHSADGCAPRDGGASDTTWPTLQRGTRCGDDEDVNLRGILHINTRMNLRYREVTYLSGAAPFQVRPPLYLIVFPYARSVIILFILSASRSLSVNAYRLLNFVVEDGTKSWPIVLLMAV